MDSFFAESMDEFAANTPIVGGCGGVSAGCVAYMHQGAANAYPDEWPNQRMILLNSLVSQVTTSTFQLVVAFVNAQSMHIYLFKTPSSKPSTWEC